MKACAIGRFDSFVSVAQSFLEGLESFGWETDLFIIDSELLSERQKQKILNRKSFTGIKSFEEINWKGYQIVYLGLTVKGIKSFVDYRNRNRLGGLKIISGYPGLVFNGVYEGMLYRSLCDFVLLNSHKDLKKYCQLKENFEITNGIPLLYGYPFLDSFSQHSQRTKKNILFIEQSIIPFKFKERLYLCQELIELAKAMPDYDVLVSLRCKKDERTLFKCRYHFEDLFGDLNAKDISNLKITYEDVHSLIDQSEIVITVSSTAILQAVFQNKKTYILSDFGCQDRYGTPFFLGSGLIASFEEIKKGCIKKANSIWLSENITSPKENFSQAYKLITQTSIRLNCSDRVNRADSQQVGFGLNFKYFLKKKLGRLCQL